ncbi:MAG: hypothetical protein HYX60_09275 [Legionella longbeachae]|nr:hypothetical protein [Legionella longbeachae]
MDNKQQKMVNWFSLSVLWDALKRSILSKLFRQYADPRLLYNTSSTYTNSNSIEEDSSLDRNKEVWFDFVADVGDGYSST